EFRRVLFRSSASLSRETSALIPRNGKDADLLDRLRLDVDGSDPLILRPAVVVGVPEPVLGDCLVGSTDDQVGVECVVVLLVPRAGSADLLVRHRCHQNAEELVVASIHLTLCNLLAVVLPATTGAGPRSLADIPVNEAARCRNLEGQGGGGHNHAEVWHDEDVSAPPAKAEGHVVGGAGYEGSAL